MRATPARSASTPRRLKILFFTLLAACTVAALADRRRLPRRRHGGDARRDRLSPHRPLRPDDRHRHGDRRRHELRSAPMSAISSTAPPAASSSVLQTLVFLAAFYFAPKHGVSPREERASPPERRHERGPRLDRPCPLSSSASCNAALIVALLVGAVCAVLSCYLVLKGWSLMGDAISHAVLPGIVIAYVLGLPLAIGAFAAGLCCALSHRLPQGEQPHQRGHGHGHRLLRHVRASAS